MSHKSVNNLCLFLFTLLRVFLYLLNQRMAIYHWEGQLRIFYLARSVPAPNSAFLWKTAVILIDEIQRCPKQSRRSPTVAHRRGAPLLPLFAGKKGARPENTREKIPTFSSKEPKKQHFFTGSGKVEENLFHLWTETILVDFFSALDALSCKDAQTRIMNWLFYCEGLMLFVFSPVSHLNDWCNTSLCIHPICACTTSLCVMPRLQAK